MPDFGIDDEGMHQFGQQQIEYHPHTYPVVEMGGEMLVAGSHESLVVNLLLSC